MGKITILDGGMGRELEAIGAPFQQPEWSALALMQAPETVIQVHHAFMDAGCDIITTNAYALCPFHIGQERFDTDGENLIKLAADIARMAADGSHKRKIQVAGCLPPVFGSYRPDLFDQVEATKLYEPLIEQQIEQVDFWLAETVASIIEAETVAAAVDKTDKDLWLSFTLKDDLAEEESSQLRSGELLSDAIEAAVKLNVNALLLNCSQPETITKALTEVKSAKLSIPYGAYANSFERVRSANENLSNLRNDLESASYLDFAKQWQSLGASIIGGCCGIGPDHIKALTSLNK